MSRMRIATAGEHARLQKTLLGKHQMTDALHIKELINTKLGGKLTG